jgi:uncharacterized DUF497 family protein
MKENTLQVYGRFEWDPAKAKTNLAEHYVSFEEASTVFDDPLFIIFADPDHSVREQRYIIIGESEERRYLIVSFTERRATTRLISARPLDPKERKSYEQKKERF